MSVESNRSGGEHLEKRSELLRTEGGIRQLKDILVVEDEERDADRIQGTLRLMIGYSGLEVRTASTISTAVDAVLERQPQLILLDDALKPSDTATDTIPFLHRAGYDGPIVVISGQVTRRRRTELMAAGATDVIHKDDVESVRIRECLAKIFPDAPVPAPPTTQPAKGKL
ncbi:MAG: response regulator [Pseudomonadota bacterium]